MAAAVQRPRRAIGWSVAIAILLNGWLPILFQAALVVAEAEAHGSGHAHHAEASAQPEANPGPTNQGPECPVLHSAVCLCAVLVKVLPGPAATAALAAACARLARARPPAQRAPRRFLVAGFEARAPPISDGAEAPT